MFCLYNCDIFDFIGMCRSGTAEMQLNDHLCA